MTMSSSVFPGWQAGGFGVHKAVPPAGGSRDMSWRQEVKEREKTHALKTRRIAERAGLAQGANFLHTRW